MNRPLVPPAVAFIAGLYLALRGSGHNPLLPGIIFVFLFALAFFFKRPGLHRVVLVSACFFASGWFIACIETPSDDLDELARFIERETPPVLTLEGTVERTDVLLPDDTFSQFVFDAERTITAQASIPISGKMIVRWTNPSSPVFSGERVRVVGVPTTKLYYDNPGVNNARRQFQIQGIHSLIRCSGAEDVHVISDEKRPRSLGYWISYLRQAQADRLARVLPRSVLPFVAAVWLGQRHGIARTEYENYIRSGTAHILAVSGIHVGIVFLFCSFFLGLFIKKERIAATIIFAVILLFCLMAGARPSVVRASFMIWVYLAADFFDRERDPVSALALSAILLPAWDPLIVQDAGFQLSFLSVASIIIFHNPISGFLQNKLRLPSLLAQPVGGTLAAQLLPLPLSVRLFNVLPWAAPLANFFIIPLLSIALWLCMLTSLFSWLNLEMGMIFGHALLPVVSLIRVIARSTVSLPMSFSTITTPTQLAVILFWIMLGVAIAPIRFVTTRIRFVCAVTLAVLTIIFWKPPTKSEITFLDVGHGDSIFVRWASGDTMLVDGGDRSEYFDAGTSVVAPFLWYKGLETIDYLVCTHSDRDHLGGLLTVLQNFKVRHVIISTNDSTQTLQKELLEACKNKGIPVREVARGDTLVIGDSSVEVLHPERLTTYGHPNDSSIVLRVAWEGLHVLLTADIGKKIEEELMSLECESEVLKVPHHGSQRSSSPAFLRRVNPLVAVISAGSIDKNETESLDTLPAKCTVLNTFKDGAITLMPAPNRIEVTSQRRGIVTSIYRN